MAKILLVEDDSNLREIYGARLEAEGYEILTAGDGEEALAVAVKERPDLIISDVMMPKISGFDMLDILRTTPETKNVKIIVMTALSQDEDRKRGEELGADKYIVKSQVTLDDVVAMVNESLGVTPAAPAVAPLDATSQTAPVEPLTPPAPAPTPTPSTAPALNDEVADFVATSPLMNGAPPSTPATTQTSPPAADPTLDETPDPQAEPPIEPPTTPPVSA